ncbi:hypothetical protein BDZ89DRAFT_1231666 [Hymenopellis radicata]|nr:hypothetical protein BDZ89DRAFT_1231666 [Hymenopellis radicata]
MEKEVQFRLASDSTRDDSRVIEDGDGGGRIVVVVGGWWWWWEDGKVAEWRWEVAIVQSSRCRVAAAKLLPLRRLSSVGAVGSASRSSRHHHPVVATVQSSIQFVVPVCCCHRDSSSTSGRARFRNPPLTGCLTIVRAAGATIVTPWVVVVVVVEVENREIPLDQTLTHRFGTRPGSPDQAG